MRKIAIIGNVGGGKILQTIIDNRMTADIIVITPEEAAISEAKRHEVKELTAYPLLPHPDLRTGRQKRNERRKLKRKK